MVMVKNQRQRRESGAVSLFLVIFAMLLITVVTLSFLRTMIADQQQASVSDLSRSAYDSSLAGVEDAKRALIYYRTVCASGDVATCAAAKAALDSTTCNQGLANVVDISNNKEVPVQQSQSANDTQLNQAYTCVKMKLETNDYVGTLEANTSKIIPLKTTGNFSQVLLQWFTTDDFGTTGTSVDLQSTPPQFDPGGTNQNIWPLLAQSSWPATRPSVMRTQMFQYGKNFTLAGFDSNTSGVSNANTMFLYPTGVTGTPNATQDTWTFTDRDTRLQPTGTPLGTTCSGKLSGGGYACSAILNLPAPIGNAPGDLTRTAYLRLTALYKATHFSVSPMNTQFDGVQPSIDSTGRANDQYRRVESRVDLIDTNFPFPEAALDVSGNLCKNFLVTDSSNTIPVDQSTCN
jgi:Tfp pilus assembly protein PilX